MIDALQRDLDGYDFCGASTTYLEFHGRNGRTRLVVVGAIVGRWSDESAQFVPVGPRPKREGILSIRAQQAWTPRWSSIVARSVGKSLTLSSVGACFGADVATPRSGVLRHAFLTCFFPFWSSKKSKNRQTLGKTLEARQPRTLEARQPRTLEAGQPRTLGAGQPETLGAGQPKPWERVNRKLGGVNRKLGGNQKAGRGERKNWGERVKPKNGEERNQKNGRRRSNKKLGRGEGAGGGGKGRRQQKKWERRGAGNTKK